MSTYIIDKEIITKFLPNEEMEYYKSEERGLMRAYKSQNGEVSLMIFDKICAKIDSKIFEGMLLNPNFNVAITRYKDLILVFLTKEKLINIILEEVPKPQNVYDEIDDNEDYCEDNQPYAYTNGKWSPCPYCGSNNITTYMDGTAQCDDCKREFRYLQY